MYNVKVEKRGTFSRSLSATTNNSLLFGSDHINITDNRPYCTS